MSREKDWKYPRCWWSVAFVVNDGDSHRLSRREAFEIMHPEDVRRVSVGPSGGGESDEVASLKLELLAETGDEARKLAEGLLERARAAMGLEEAPSVLAWVIPLTDENASSTRFLEKAEELLDDDDELDMAVIAAQIHLEVQVRVLLEEAIKDDAPEWVGVFMKVRGLGNLNNSQTQELFRRLLGIEVRQMPEWAAYEKHNLLRNAIAHEGQAVERGPAEASVSTVRAITRRLADAGIESSREGQAPGAEESEAGQ